ncbi:MAG: rhomboid family intramembrane serine protease [Hyphomonas sp.]|nr:rhomboid family intramembrane serine protease [Hyphomonas sp.]MCA8905992.1 rhomboid family intramembrane serine protease [Hyphomonas sp.]MCB9963013.1 rhomboid family intramembrane serine protease [Hyphomonas sp.]MCB9972362.1 rhomboid family intramembrane serine protease [Hyphomonas sp.]
MEAFTTSPVTFALLAANIVASVVALTVPDFMDQNSFWIRPVREQKQWHRLLTSGFLHVNGAHLLVNMLTLYFFGPLLEAKLGSVNFILLYFGSLIGGSLWMVVDKYNRPDYRAIGASGAISGLMSAVGLLFPFATIYVFFALPIWAGLYALLFIVVSFIYSQRENTMIAHGAHLGGALAGLVITLLLQPEALDHLMRQLASRFG